MPAMHLVWFRSDLRVADNPALHAAMSSVPHVPVLALFIHERRQGLRPRTGAARWWLHRSLNAHAKTLAALGIPFRVETGDPAEVLARVIAETGSSHLYWNRRYGPAERELDAGLKRDLGASGISVTSFPGDVLKEPFEMETGAGKPYSVYTPFWKTLRQQPIAPPLPAPMPRTPVAVQPVDADYTEPHWSTSLAAHWEIGEAAAAARLSHFLDTQVARYAEARDIPAEDVTSGLSPYLAFGEISPRQIWHAARLRTASEPALEAPVEKFLSELAWREFNINQLYHRPDISRFPMVEKFGRLPWRDDPAALTCWQKGQTGFPIIDAGMRELWQTGTMHNRVRMLVASLLAKNLMMDWRLGENWFWDTLLDADPANNPGNWQWVAGTGLDASPYFRIFNPVTQGERFDPDGRYVRRFVPELAQLPDAWIHKPWEAPPALLTLHGIRLGSTYPHPLVDLKDTRDRALETFKALTEGA